MKVTTDTHRYFHQPLSLYTIHHNPQALNFYIWKNIKFTFTGNSCCTWILVLRYIEHWNITTVLKSHFQMSDKKSAVWSHTSLWSVLPVRVAYCVTLNLTFHSVCWHLLSLSSNNMYTYDRAMFVYPNSVGEASQTLNQNCFATFQVLNGREIKIQFIPSKMLF